MSLPSTSAWRRCAGAALSLLATAAVAAESEPTHPLAESAESSLIIDAAAVRTASAETPLLSLWHDPAFAEQRAHIQDQLGLLQGQDDDLPPFASLLENVGVWYLAFNGTIPDQQQMMRGQAPDMFFALQPQAAMGELREWIDNTVPVASMNEQTLGGITGRSMGGMAFFGFTDELFVLGVPELVTAFGAAGAALPTLDAQRIAHSHSEFGFLVDILAQLADYDQQLDPRMSALLGPAWRDSDPVLDLHTRIDSALGWSTAATFTGLATAPLRPVGDLATRLPRQADIQLVTALDPATALSLVLTAMSSSDDPFTTIIDGMEQSPADERNETDAMLQRMLGIDLATATAVLSGEIGLSLRWGEDGSDIPAGVAVLGITDAEQASTVLEQSLAMLQPQVAELAGAEQAWTIPLPFGPLTLAVGPGHLVLGSDPEDVRAALAGEGGGSSSEDAALHLGIDLAAVGERWLPVAFAALEDVDQTLGSDPLQPLQMILWSMNEPTQQDGETLRPSAVVLGENTPWLRDNLGELYGEEDLEATLDTHLSIWQKVDEHSSTGFAIVVQTADGFRLFERMQQDGAALDQAALLEALAGYELLAGPPLAELAVTELPTVARFDRRWLPDTQLALAHLPERYDLTVRVAADGLQVDEHGLPLAAPFGHILGLMAMTSSQMMGWRLAELKKEAEGDEVAARHVEVVAAMRAAGEALRAIQQQGDEVPAKASELVTLGHLQLEDMRGLFGGQVPASATALDQAGRWQQDPDGWPQAIWAVHLEPGWAVYIGNWGSVEISNELDPIPPTPADAATGGDPESLF